MFAHSMALEYHDRETMFIGGWIYVFCLRRRSPGLVYRDKKEMNLDDLPIPAMHYEYENKTDKKLVEEAAFWAEDGEGHDKDISAVIEWE